MLYTNCNTAVGCKNRFNESSAVCFYDSCYHYVVADCKHRLIEGKNDCC